MSEPSAHAAGPTGLFRITAITATVGVVLAMFGLASLFRPVTTPVQDCGTAIAFVLDGRTNVGADPDDPPEGLTSDDVVSNNERPCRVRVAATIRPGAITMALGLTMALLALIVEVSVRIQRWFVRRRHAV